MKRIFRAFSRKAMKAFLKTRIGKLFLKHRYISTNKKLVNIIDQRNPAMRGDELTRFIRAGGMGLFSEDFIRLFLQEDDAKGHFNIGGAILPNITGEKKIMENFYYEVFRDIFLMRAFFDDDYDNNLIQDLYSNWGEGPYGYKNGGFDVSVKPGDVVVDAGAWIGDFSAYAASKGAYVYAFEPQVKMFGILQETASLNDAKIYPVQKGLGKEDCYMELDDEEADTGGSMVARAQGKGIGVKIPITTLDTFVEENKIAKIDFIKADIEGSERDMLKEASRVLKKFAPKLAICTYHYPEDPELLSKIIIEANPQYKIVHLRKKLFAMVP